MSLALRSHLLERPNFLGLSLLTLTLFASSLSCISGFCLQHRVR